MNSVDLLYAALKVTSMIAAGAFGVLGLVTKYKDDEGKMTKWGKLAITGILISLFISLSVFSIETSKAKMAAIKSQAEANATAMKLETILSKAQITAELQQNSLKQTNLLKLSLEKTIKKSDYIAKGMETSIKEVSRGLHPIKDVVVDYSISVPMIHPQLSGYLNRFNNMLTTYPRLNMHDHISGISGGRSDGDGNYEEIGISSDGPFAPDNLKEKLAKAIFGYSQLELHFFKKPINPNSHPRITSKWYITNWDVKPDLRFCFKTGMAGLRSEHQIYYELLSKQFSLSAYDLQPEPQHLESNGNIIGIPDLLGAQLFVILPSEIISGDPEIDQYLKEIRKAFELSTISISLSSGRKYWLRREDFKKGYDKDGLPIYSYTFPNTFEGLRKLQLSF